jgi:competence protein ComEA
MFHVTALVLVLILVILVEHPIVVTTATAAEAARAATTGSTEKVNINTADAKTLASLSGVSRGLAEKIVKYRDEHGAFKKPEDLRRVDGVGHAVLEKNRERISVK